MVSTDSAHSLRDALDRELGPEPAEILPRLHAVEVDVNRELESHWGTIHEFLTRFMTFRGVDETVAEEIAILPGMEELFSLVRVAAWAQEGRFDTIVIDCAPTGDTIRMLAVPEVLSFYFSRIFPIQRTVRAHGAPGGPAHDRHADPDRRRVRRRAARLPADGGHRPAAAGPVAQLDPDRAEPRADGDQRVAAALHLPEPVRLPGRRDRGRTACCPRRRARRTSTSGSRSRPAT